MRLNLLLVAVLAAAIVGCSSDGEERRQQYLDADYYTRLELPPDLTQPGNSQQLSVPKPTDDAMAKFKTDTEHLGKLDSNGDVVASAEATPVLPALKGVELKSDNGLFWLEVASNDKALWPRLNAFWDKEGVPVLSSEPLLGIIETDWVSKFQAEPDAGWFKRVFNKIEPDRLDKFRMRVQAEAGNANQSRVYVSHSGMEQVLDEGTDYLSWHARCSESGLEQDILSRLALYLGLDPAQAKVALANYKPYASRVSVPRPGDGSDSINLTTNNPNLYLNEAMAEAWPRTRQALARLNANIVDTNVEQHEYTVALEKLKLPTPEGQERDEIAESSWMMKWFSSIGDDSGDDAGSQFKIALAEEASHKVKLSILDLDGKPAAGAQAVELRRRLALELQ